MITVVILADKRCNPEIAIGMPRNSMKHIASMLNPAMNNSADCCYIC